MEEIVLVGKNDVEVRTIYYKDPEGKEPVVIEVKSYGNDRLNLELNATNTQLPEWQKLQSAGIIDFQEQNVAERVAELQTWIDKLNKIKELLTL